MVMLKPKNIRFKKKSIFFLQELLKIVSVNHIYKPVRQILVIIKNSWRNNNAFVFVDTRLFSIKVWGSGKKLDKLCTRPDCVKVERTHYTLHWQHSHREILKIQSKCEIWSHNYTLGIIFAFLFKKALSFKKQYVLENSNKSNI